MKEKRNVMTEEEIDDVVTAQAGDESAWVRPVHVKRKGLFVSFPSAVAERAAFFAKVHEENVEKWLQRIVKERLDLEEAAFSTLKKEYESGVRIPGRDSEVHSI